MTGGDVRASAPSRPRILIVDDEPKVLDGLTRGLRRAFETVTATSGELGVSALQSSGPFAVVMSDMRMPGMNGAQFLSLARELAPNAVRILLTGFADVNAAAAAVNDGQIFRLLQKPCPVEVVDATLRDAIQQHRLVVSEQELLQQTVRGSVEVMTEVLAIVSPVAFARALRLKTTVSALAAIVRAPNAWAIEVAALLSQLGGINVRADLLQRFYRDDHLDAEEYAQIVAASGTAQHLISHIPRLEAVREILHHVHEVRAGESLGHRVSSAKLPAGARLLSLAMDFDRLESRGIACADVVDLLASRPGVYDPDALIALRQTKCAAATAVVLRQLRLSDVTAGMVFARDVVAENGLVLIGRGQQATPSLVRRIQAFWLDLPLKEAALVYG